MWAAQGERGKSGSRNSAALKAVSYAKGLTLNRAAPGAEGAQPCLSPAQGGDTSSSPRAGAHLPEDAQAHQAEASPKETTASRFPGNWGGKAVLNSWNVVPCSPSCSVSCISHSSGEPSQKMLWEQRMQERAVPEQKLGVCGSSSQEHPSRVTLISWAASHPIPRILGGSTAGPGPGR